MCDDSLVDSSFFSLHSRTFCVGCVHGTFSGALFRKSLFARVPFYTLFFISFLRHSTFFFLSCYPVAISSDTVRPPLSRPQKHITKEIEVQGKYQALTSLLACPDRPRSIMARNKKEEDGSRKHAFVYIAESFPSLCNAGWEARLRDTMEILRDRFQIY